MHLLSTVLVCFLALESIQGGCREYETAVKCFNAEETDLPSSNNPNITRLNLHNSQVSRLKRSFLQNLPNLYELNAEDGGITSIDSDAFKGLTEVYWVELMNNNLHDLDPDTFLDAEKLFYFSIAGNNNITLPKNKPFINLKVAQWIFMRHCGIKEVYVETFQGLPGLFELSLTQNLLETLPEGVFNNNPWLEFLDLSDNKFSTLSPVVFTGLEAALILFHENPWKCDCHLTPLIQWSNEHLTQTYVYCGENSTEVWQHIEYPPQCTNTTGENTI